MPPAPPVQSATPGDTPPPARAEEFVLRFGRALHTAGTPAHRLEEALSKIAARLGQTASFFSTPTSLFAAFGAGADQRVRLERMEPAELDLERLVRVDDIADAVAGGIMSPAEGEHALDAVERSKPRFGAISTVLAFALASAAVAVFLRGGWPDTMFGALAGAVVGLIAVALGRHRAARRIVEVAAGFAAAAVGLAAERVSGDTSSLTVTLAGVIVLLPGLTITLAVSELATRHLVSGTARLVGALVVLVTVSVGVALGRRLAPLFADAPALAIAPAPPWAILMALALAPVAFTVLFKARPRDYPAIAIAGAVGYLGARSGSALLGPELGAGAGAFAVGATSNLYARLLDQPAAVPMLPGIMLLVPGSLGFRSIDSLLADDVLGGVEAGFAMALVAVSLAAGLLLANVAVPARRAL
jgi:uncharacterized membrane protein YjjP (DUF1212 family)